MRVGSYGRLSVWYDGADALDRQDENIDGFCDQRGWPIVRRFSDPGKSGWNRKVHRKDFREMIAAVERHEFDVLVAWKLDRLTRNLRDFTDLFLACEDAGVLIMTVADGVDTSTPQGSMTAHMAFIIAKQESDNISLRVRDKLDRNARSGKPHGGRAFGYQAGNFEVEEQEAAIVREVYERFLAGEGVVALSLELKKRGVVGPKGVPFSARSVGRMLSNPRYCGIRRFTKTDAQGKPEVHEVAATWEPLVTKEQFEAAQARLVHRRGPHASPRSYLLTGLIFCHCGQKMLAMPMGRMRRYGCPSGEKSGQNGCGHVYINADTLEKRVAERALAELASPEFVAQLPSEDTTPAERSAIENLASAEARQESLAQQWALGEIDDADYGRRLAAITQVVSTARKALEGLERVAHLAGLPRNPEELPAFWEGLSFARRRGLVEAVIRQVEVRPALRLGTGMDPRRYTIRLRERSQNGGTAESTQGSQGHASQEFGVADRGRKALLGAEALPVGDGQPETFN